MANIIKIKRGLSSDLSKANLQEGEIAFTTDTKKLYVSTTAAPINENTTYKLTKSGSTITLTGSDGTTTSVTDSNTTYTHPTSAGNKHIPSGGEAGQILRWSAAGTAVWGADNNTTYSNASTSVAGLMSAADKTKLDGIASGANKYSLPAATASALGGVIVGSNITVSSGTISLTKANVTSALGYTPPTTNTTYSVVSTTADGLCPKRGGTTTKFLRDDGTWATPPDTNTTYSNMTAATASAAGKAGLVPAPAAGKQTSFLRGDGTWVVPTNTTYNTATTSAAGLMSAADKTKLDGITTSADSVSFTRSLTSGTKIGTITINGTGTDIYCQTDTNTTYSAATTSTAGLMSAADKTKLDGIATGANKYTLPTASSTLGGVKTTSTVTSTSGLTACPIISGVVYYKDTNTTYTHPTTSGNKHIPSGGSSGQILRWSADGTAVWGADNNTTYSAATTSANGLMTSAMVTKLNGIATGAQVNNVVVSTSTPTASTAQVWINPNGQTTLEALSVIGEYAECMIDSHVTMTQSENWADPIVPFTSLKATSNSSMFSYASNGIKCNFAGRVLIIANYSCDTRDKEMDPEISISNGSPNHRSMINVGDGSATFSAVVDVNNGSIITMGVNCNVLSWKVYSSTAIRVIRLK